MRVRLIHQCLRRIKLKYLAFLHHHNPITRHNSLQPMRNRQPCTLLKLRIQKLQNKLLRLKINRSRSLIHNQNLRRIQGGAGYTKQLSLTY